MSGTGWLEAALIVDGEMAESVAEILARFTPDGVVIESTEIAADEFEGHVVGPLRVAGYLPVNEELESVRQKLDEALWYLSRIRPLPAVQYTVVQQADWAEAWKRNYQPIAVGGKLKIIPAWLEEPESERIPIRIDPGMAFGTGTHPTTQLCLEYIEDIVSGSVKLHPGGSLDIIDVGCGSAILSIAGVKLGASRALGIDIDPEAIKAAQDNIAANMVGEYIELAVGSLADILAGKYSLKLANLVVANILAPVLVRMLSDGLGRLLAPNGSLILSGILKDQVGDVEAALNRAGLHMTNRREIDDWVALRASAA